MVSTRQSSIVASSSSSETSASSSDAGQNSSSNVHTAGSKLLRSGLSAPPCSPPSVAPPISSVANNAVVTWNSNSSTSRSLTLLKLPPEILEKIFSYLGYKQVAHLRQVCRTLDKVCQQILNSSFQRLQNQMLQRFQAIKAKMPRRESARRNHPLACESDIIETLHMRLTLLQMTFGKHIERKHCCFFAGEILDEVNRILHYVKVTNKLARPYKVTDELFDLTTMAMEFFKEHIEPTLPEIAYFGSDFIEFTFNNGSSSGKYFSLDSPPHGSGKGYESPTSGNEASASHDSQPVVQSNLVLRKRIRKIKQGMKRYSTQLAVLRRDLRASKNKIAEQQKQLIEYSSRMDEYDKKHEETVRKFSTLLQELNKCKTELQYWRSRTPAMPVMCDAPTPTPSEESQSLPEVALPIGLNVEPTNPLEAIEFPAEASTSNEEDLWKIYETTAEEGKMKPVKQSTVVNCKASSPKHAGAGSSNISSNAINETPHVTIKTPLTGKPKNMKRRVTDDDFLQTSIPAKKSKRNLKNRSKRVKL